MTGSCAARSVGGSKGHAGGLRHRRRGFGWLRAGQPADRGCRHARRADRGRRPRLESADPHSRRLHEAAGSPDADLGLQGRGGSGHQRPRDQLSARPRARRVEFDQRHDLCPRPAGGFRPLGDSSAIAAGRGTTCCRSSARRRTGRARKTRCTARAARCSPRVGAIRPLLCQAAVEAGQQLGLRVPRGRQRSAAGLGRRHRLGAADARWAPTRQRGAQLSASGGETAESASGHRRTGASRAARRNARDRRRSTRAMAGWNASMPRRGDPGRRRHRLAAYPAAFRHRRPRTSRAVSASRLRHATARRRQESAGPLPRARVLRGPGCAEPQPDVARRWGWRARCCAMSRPAPAS